MTEIESNWKNLISTANKNIRENNDTVAVREIEVRDKTAQKDKARNSLTFHFLWGFFALIVGCFLFVFWYNSHAVEWITTLNSQRLSDTAGSVRLLELDKVLSVIIGTLGTSLGFIIGYYFKEKKS
ncbi:TPA: hypothetical protein ACWL6U_003656 [Morganella morganii]|jgi:hypothetical protein|nr:hypothetical protein [Morganella morganii]